MSFWRWPSKTKYVCHFFFKKCWYSDPCCRPLLLHCVMLLHFFAFFLATCSRFFICVRCKKHWFYQKIYKACSVLIFSLLLSSTFAALCHVASLFCFCLATCNRFFICVRWKKNTDFTKKYTMYVQSPKASANYLRALFANDTVLTYVCNVDFNRNS